MTTSVQADRGRGRPRQFNENEVLDALVELFWEQGFEAASLADIVETAGLNKSSLYNAFGSKDELFQRVLDRYLAGREAMLEQATSDGRGLDALHDFIGMIEQEAMSESGRRGCLAINSTAELGFASTHMVEAAQRYRDMLRRYVRRPLERAAELGEIAPDLVDVYVNTTISYMMATAVTARGGASDQELGAHFDSMRALVASWRVD